MLKIKPVNPFAVATLPPLNLLWSLLPSYRFVRTDETIIHCPHPHLSQLDESHIRVLNWNIAKNNQDETWIQDFEKILQRYQPNVICPQEVRMCAEAKHLVEVAKLGWSFAPNFIDTYHNSYAGVLTAAKASCVTRKSYTTQHSEPFTKTPKVSLFTEYSLARSSQTLLAINTHLINFVDLEKFKTQLRDLETAIATHTGAVILSGDFNTWNRSRLLMLTTMVRRLGLTRAKFPPDEAQNIKRFLLSPPLDHIFYRGLQQNYLSARVLDEITSSDHKPMLVEFSMS
jgi:endonuclease/exonuclease/phosphatase (EEP) superfamily protein YafD